MLPEVCTPKELAKDLNVGVHLIKNAIKEGKLAAMKLSNKTYRIDREDYYDFKERMKCQNKIEGFKQSPDQTEERGKLESMSKANGNGTKRALQAIERLETTNMPLKKNGADILHMRQTNA